MPLAVQRLLGVHLGQEAQASHVHPQQWYAQGPRQPGGAQDGAVTTDRHHDRGLGDRQPLRLVVVGGPQGQRGAQQRRQPQPQLAGLGVPVVVEQLHPRRVDGHGAGHYMRARPWDDRRAVGRCPHARLLDAPRAPLL